MGKKQIVTFGEIMLRLAPYDYERIIQANSFQINYGGGEANVAVSLANFSNEVFFVSRLPDNPLGNAALNAMRKFGVNISYILRGGGRIGVYFLEYGSSIRPSKVIYDRAHSAISEIKPGMLKWNEIFSGKDWFHGTGITPAISKSAAEATIEAVIIAKDQGLTVSCDLNYRKKLWNREDAKRTMTEVVKYVDIVIGNEEHASDVFGIESANTDVKSGNLSLDHYKTVASGGAKLPFGGSGFPGLTVGHERN